TMQRLGGVADDEMYRAFNMGVGMVCVVAPERAAEVAALLDAAGEARFEIGAIVEGAGSVVYA
ncbi:MAG TPA: AIR synthase-related protein, partial [Candidatus Polarisedimenticolaceae bacterium]|nr:AIR synthase-related protein [Candidatus Polarisedimenticolaceae bacterium]